jgi:hypothetical protein
MVSELAGSMRRNCTVVDLTDTTLHEEATNILDVVQFCRLVVSIFEKAIGWAKRVGVSFQAADV